MKALIYKCKSFRFRKTKADEINKFIKRLDPKKASRKCDIITNVLKVNAAFLLNISTL